jgi:hypothetical protein
MKLITTLLMLLMTLSLSSTGYSTTNEQQICTQELSCEINQSEEDTEDESEC